MVPVWTPARSRAVRNGFRAVGAALIAVLMATPARFACAEEGGEAALARVRQPPLGLPLAPKPASNPPAAAAIGLGRKLFFDARLSADGRLACASCHQPDRAFTQTGLRLPVGITGKPLARNAPSLLNVAYMRHIMQDGEAHSLEAQMLAPLFLPDEMGNTSIAAFVARVAALPDYAGAFEESFGEAASIANIGKALAGYERTLVSGNSPFDRWHFAGDEAALSPQAKAGYSLFTGKAGCASCHEIGEHDALFTDQGFHNTGIGARAGAEPQADHATDLGRETVTHDRADRFKYRTPMLRGVALTAPYMHDGSLASLEDVVRFYNAGGLPNPGLDPLIHPLGLTDEEIASLVAFLESLTGDNLDVLAREAGAIHHQAAAGVPVSAR